MAKGLLLRKKQRRLHIAVYIALAVFLFETALRIEACDKFFDIGLLYIALFDTVLIAALLLLSTLFKNERANRAIAATLLTLIGVYFCAQIVYYRVFGVLFVLFSLGGATQVLDYMPVIIETIGRCSPYIIAIMLPGVGLFFLKRFVDARQLPLKWKAAAVLCAAACHIGAWQLVVNNKKDAVSVSYIYQYTFLPETSLKTFGLFTTVRLDFLYLFTDIKEPPPGPPVIDGDPMPIEIGLRYNIDSSLDLAALAASASDEELKAMHLYFDSRTPTEQNDWTGVFEGKNLIFIIAEGFAPYVIHEELMPTLHMMAEEGFQFNNFYVPLWGTSTTDGEYMTLLSLVPKSGVWALAESAKNYLPYSMGNVFKQRDYATWAYHNWKHNSYRRYKSHPNLGYTFRAMDYGMDIKYRWPTSDYEMGLATYDELVSSTPFHAYYLTMSGHLPYNFTGHTMAVRHKKAVASLPYSTKVKAYVSCHIELENFLKYLVDNLEKDGLLEDTVFVITPDHYPYGLLPADITELTGRDATGLELYRSGAIIWTPSLSEKPPVVIDDYCSSFDLLPTVLNLFGTEYDSRLLMGVDLMSDAMPLVVFKDRSFICNMASYDAAKNLFVPFSDTLPADFLQSMTARVNDQFTYSAKVLTRDYYRIIFKGK